VESVKSVSENEPLGSLWIGDQLYNALHGVGDISREHRIAVINIMHDYYHPDKKIVPPEAEANENFRVGRDEIIHIVRACLASVPQTAEPILTHWADQIKAEFGSRVAECEKYMAAHVIEEVSHK
jgi:hypothetical protein